MQGWLLVAGVAALSALLALACAALIARGERRPKSLRAHGTAGRAAGAGFVNFDDFMRGRPPTTIVASEMATMDGEAEARLGGSSGEPE